LPFLLLTRSPLALFVIWFTHFLIDRFRLAKYVIYVKNLAAPWSYIGGATQYGSNGDAISELKPQYQWENCKVDRLSLAKHLIWLAIWLMIIADNTMHLAINYLSLRFL
jgi:hypothetical protein